MPLVLAEAGKTSIIKKVNGSPDVKQHLENMGFVPGEHIKVINILGENVIVKVKESRVAISGEMAQKIMI